MKRKGFAILRGSSRRVNTGDLQVEKQCDAQQRGGRKPGKDMERGDDSTDLKRFPVFSNLLGVRNFIQVYMYSLFHGHAVPYLTGGEG